jgi:aryl-phospho-beta-D-glucosidase BglC (GH1 family)
MGSTACGGTTASAPNNAGGQTVTVTVVPALAQVLPAAPVSFTAALTGTADLSVTWSVVEANGGSVDATGHYTAPSTPGTYHVVVRSVADSTVAATATVEVSTGASAVSVSVAPQTTSVATRGTATFIASVAGTSNTAVTWSIQESSGCGSVTQGGVYTAPGSATTCHVVATSAADSTKSATATVTVTSGTTPPPATSMSGLHVSGNKVLNGAGQTVRLLGANYSQAEYACMLDGQTFYAPPDQALVNTWKSWGFTAIRLPLDENCWLGTNGVPIGGLTAARYQAEVKAAVDLITSNGIAVIVDLHRSWPGTGTPGNRQTCMPDADHSPAFWTSAATMFKDNSAVLFDLFNEPCAPDWSCWANGGACGQDDWGTINYTAVGMKSLLSNVRATGATNIVVIGGNQYAHDLSGWVANKPTDTLNPPQIMAAQHMYGDECGANNACLTRSSQYGDIASISASYPVLMGEFGGSYGGGTNENLGCGVDIPTAFMTFLNGLGQHYTAWNWNWNPISGNCNNGDFPLTSNGNAGAPTPWGAALQSGIAGR